MLQITGTRESVVKLPSDSLSFLKTSSPQNRDQGSARLQDTIYIQAPADQFSEADGSFPGTSPSCAWIQGLGGSLHGFH